VTVKDNRLTLDAGSSPNLATRLDYITGALLIETFTPIAPTVPLTFDFSPTYNRVFGEITDKGDLYTDPNQQHIIHYGWSVSEIANTIARHVNSDKLLDTSVAVNAGAKWELLLPNGTYKVTVGIGDAGAASTNTVTLEGTTIASKVALAANHFTTRTATITVTDGKLTLGVGAAANLATRLTFLTVAKA
jgi:archaellum component FlaF (FlaF/FlaG flagellin family)